MFPWLFSDVELKSITYGHEPKDNCDMCNGSGIIPLYDGYPEDCPCTMRIK
jgi:hypothetical protein